MTDGCASPCASSGSSGSTRSENRTSPGSRTRATTLAALGEICYRMGDTAAAWDYYRQSVSIATEFGNLLHVAMGLDGLAAVVLDMGQLTLAARLSGAAEALVERIGARFQLLELKLHDDYCAKLVAALEASEVDRAWSDGRATSIDTLVGQMLTRE